MHRTYEKKIKLCNLMILNVEREREREGATKEKRERKEKKLISTHLNVYVDQFESNKPPEPIIYGQNEREGEQRTSRNNSCSIELVIFCMFIERQKDKDAHQGKRLTVF